jgi:molybdopterin converting factor subunit 1
MMRVLLFARARELAGAEAVNVELPPGATVRTLRIQLASDHPRLAGFLERCAVAVDNEYADDATILSANAEVALVPPVSGG